MSLNPETLKSLLSESAITEESIGALSEMINEALVGQKIELATAHEAKVAELTEAHAAALADAAELSDAKLTEAVDHAVEGYIAENEQRFVLTEKFEQMQTVFEAVKTAFESNGFTLNEDARAVELTGKLQEATADYDQLLERFMALKEEKTGIEAELETAKRSIIFESAVKELTDTQRERVGKLVETVDFADTAEFATGLKLIVEMEFKKDSKKDDDKDDKGDDEDDGDEKDDGKKKKGEGDSLKESRVDAKDGRPLHALTAEERMARYKQAR